jgi:GH24 family phage-related lysozyme (muramidase)
MVSLAQVDRGLTTATFSFVITKISTDPPPAKQDPTLIMVVTDDHGNDYKQVLNYAPRGSPSEFVPYLPVGFQYKISVSLPVPRAAPIAKLRIGVSTALVDVDLSKQAQLLTMKDFGDARLSPGGSLTVTRFQKFSFGAISPGILSWYIPVKIENSDYNDGPPMSVQVLSQLGDGEVFVLPSQDIPTMRGLASSVLSLPVPRILGGQPLDQTLLFFFKDKTTGTQIVRFWSAKSSDFPPRVGQGAGAGESLFVDAYQESGGQAKHGNPVGLPRWLSGGGVPSGPADLWVQDFPSVSAFGKSMILWDRQKAAKSAFVIHGAPLETYLRLGGTQSTLGYPTGSVSKSRSGSDIVDFQKGYIGTDDGTTYQAFDYPAGRIAFSCPPTEFSMCTLDLNGVTFTNLKSFAGVSKSVDGGSFGNHGALSPDGASIAYESGFLDFGRDFESGETSRSNIVVRNLSTGQSYVAIAGGSYPAWSPDGNSIAYVTTQGADITRDIVGRPVVNTIIQSVKISQGTTTKTVASFRDPYSYPFSKTMCCLSWSPDGSRLAFVMGQTVFTVSADGSGLASVPVVGPDPSSTVFVKVNHPNYRLRYKDRWVECTHPDVACSPDGKWLAFYYGSYNPIEIYLLGPGDRIITLPDINRSAYQETGSIWSSWSWIGAAPSPPESTKTTTNALSGAGLGFIALHEGFSPTLYDDPAGHCTIGFGHLVHRGKCDSSEPEEFRRSGGISEQRASELLKADAAVAERAVSTSVTVPMNQAQFDALVSFAYNLGEGNLRQSDLLKKLNAGDYHAVPEELNRWVFAGEQKLSGLVERRRDEGVLFKEGRYGTSATSAVGPTVPGPTEAGVKEIPALVELQAIECKLESSYRSSEGGSSTTILFTNQTRQAVNTYWLDYAGGRRHYMTLEPGKEYVQQTYVGHPWVVYGPSGQCLAIYQPSERPARAVIS